MDSYIVRVYRRGTGSSSEEIAGLVEEVGTNQRRSFQSVLGLITTIREVVGRCNTEQTNVHKLNAGKNAAVNEWWSGLRTTIVRVKKMQMKSTLVTMKTAASMVILVAMGSSTAYASYVPLTPELPGNTPAGFPNFGYTEKARVPEQGQQGFNLKAGGIGNIPDSVCIPVNAMVDGGCIINEVVYFTGKFAPMVKNFRADGKSSVAAVPVPAAVWLFGSGLIGLVGMMRRRKHWINFKSP
jgi:hypothetical protein